MSRHIFTVMTALCLFIAAPVRATDTIIIDLDDGLSVGAGWGELTPERHDLRITVTAPANRIFYNDMWAWDQTGSTWWDLESYSETTQVFVSYDAQEDEMGWIDCSGTVFDPNDPDPWLNGEYFSISVSNVLWPCGSCPADEWGMPLNPDDCTFDMTCSLLEEGEVEIAPGSDTATSVTIHHGMAGTLTILGATGGLQVLNPDESLFSSAYVTGSGVSSVSLLLRADATFTGQLSLTARFLQDGADLDSQDVLVVNEAPAYHVAEIVVDGGINAVSDGPNATEFQNFSGAVREAGGEAFFKAIVLDAAGNPVSEQQLDNVDPNLIQWTGGMAVGDEQTRRRIGKGAAARTILTARTPDQPANQAAEMRAYIVWATQTGFLPSAGVNPDVGFPEFCRSQLGTLARSRVDETGRFGPDQNGQFRSQVQIQFTVAPPELITDGDAELFEQSDFKWDVKRDARPLRLQLPSDTGVWEPLIASGPGPNEWSNDDLTENDDDVNPWDQRRASERPPGAPITCPGGGHLYDMDWPGNSNQPPDENIVGILAYDNFRQFVHVGIGAGANPGVLCSDFSYWHSCWVVDKVTGTWRETPNGVPDPNNTYLNETSPGLALWGPLPPPFSDRAVEITTTTLPQGQVGIAYNASITANPPSSAPNATVTFNVDAGAFPPGLTLNPNGQIIDTPTEAGTFQFVVEAASDAPNSISDLAELTITIQ